MSEKAKMGRPIVGEKKDIKLTIRVDSSTYEAIRDFSKKNNISYSEYIRRLVKENHTTKK